LGEISNLYHGYRRISGKGWNPYYLVDVRGFLIQQGFWNGQFGFIENFGGLMIRKNGVRRFDSWNPVVVWYPQITLPTRWGN
jgi:hypothetical protein